MQQTTPMLPAERHLTPVGPQPEERTLVDAIARNDSPVPSASLHPLAPVPASTTLAPSVPSHHWLLRSQKVFVVVLAASFLMTSLAALFLAYLAQHPLASPASTKSTFPLAD